MPIGSLPEFMVNGGAPADCNVYIDPLMQVDLTGCAAVAASSQNQGGKIIIHAYISGYSLSYCPQKDNQVSVKKGNPVFPYSDSDGWVFNYNSGSLNGPIVTIPTQQLLFIQVSFLTVRMDFYSDNYPLNSQLLYSSSHIFTDVSQFNTAVPLSQTTTYNSHYFELPDVTYYLYGLSSFSFKKAITSVFSVDIQLSKNSFTANNLYDSIGGVIISGDMFIKNIEQICNAKSN